MPHGGRLHTSTYGTFPHSSIYSVRCIISVGTTIPHHILGFMVYEPPEEVVGAYASRPVRLEFLAWDMISRIWTALDFSVDGGTERVPSYSTKQTLLDKDL